MTNNNSSLMPMVTFSRATPVLHRPFETSKDIPGKVRPLMLNSMSNVAPNANGLKYGDKDLEAFFIPYPQPNPLLNEFQWTTLLPYQSLMASMPFWLSSISSPSSKSSYLARPRTPCPNSFNTILQTFSPILDYQEPLSLIEGPPSFPNSPKPYGNSSLSRHSPPPLICDESSTISTLQS